MDNSYYGFHSDFIGFSRDLGISWKFQWDFIGFSRDFIRLA